MIHTTRHQFSNGLTLLLIESHQAPVVSLNLCVRVGSRYEADHEAGICHLIEHMLFKGTKRLGPGEVARQIEANGGDVNAYTSFDETVYYATLSSRHWKRGFEVMADAVLNSVIDPVELDREREVVIEEILRGKDNPGRLLSDTLFQKAFQNHYYGRPIIGFPETVRGFSRKKVYDFYRRWYAPQNMVVVLAGDFPGKEAFRLCESLLARLPKKAAPQEKKRIEPRQKQVRSFTLAKPVQGSTMMLGYHVPELTHEDIPALDVMSHLLGEGESSRLDQNVKEKQGLVNSIYSYVYTPEDPGLMVVGYSLPEKNISSATRAIFGEIKKLQAQPIEPEELSRAKLNIKSDAIYERETVEGLARKYGYFETILRQHDFEDQYFQKIDGVTRDDILEVANKYLTHHNLTMGLIQPQLSKKKWKTTALTKLAPHTKKKAKTLKRRSEVEHVRLKNGLRLIFRENHNVPTFVIRTASLAGVRAENPKNNGIHSLLSHVWGKSTENLSVQAFTEKVEGIAGSIDAYTGRNSTGMKADFLSEKIKEGTELFLEAFLKPRFEPKEIAREKDNILEALRREEDALANLSFKQFLKCLYPTHPYGLPMLGEAKTIKGMFRPHLKKQFRRVLNPKQTVIGVVGDFETSQMLDLLGPSLEKIRPLKTPLKISPMDPAPTTSQLVEKHLEKFQAHLVYGFRGARFQDPDRYALDVLNNILAGQGGRLFLELRDKMSLAYSVTSMSQEGIEPGYFGVYIATEASKVDTAIAGIERELKKVTQKKIPAKEMDRAKQYMVGNYEIELQRNASVATQLAFNELYGIPRDEWSKLPEKILKVSPQQVEAVARRIIKLDRHVLSIVRPKGENIKK